MRAWNFRQLGLGSSITSDTLKSGYTDRFGNFALEGNIEYRFNVFSFSSVKIGTALFADMGNIWSLKYDPQTPNAEFNISRLGRDLAIAVGTGLRFDFNYFLIRFDLGYKLKDPARQYNNGWSELSHLTWTETRSNGAQINNYAVQFGINLPF
jgi:outer membrane protein assembly factor BamA